MQIAKIGHCCLLIKTGSLIVLTDPGAFSVSQNSIKGIDVVLITHEHGDHLHVDSVKAILKNNPKAKVVTNSAVGKILTEAQVPHEVLENGKGEIGGLKLEAFEAKHEEIYKEIGQVQNTAYFIAEKLFYPGDSFFNPFKVVDVLALPVAGPWCRMRSAVDFALALKPRIAFPVHDGMIQEDKIGVFHRIPENVLKENGIEFVAMKAGDVKEF